MKMPYLSIYLLFGPFRVKMFVTILLDIRITCQKILRGINYHMSHNLSNVLIFIVVGYTPDTLQIWHVPDFDKTSKIK